MTERIAYNECAELKLTRKCLQ